MTDSTGSPKTSPSPSVSDPLGLTDDQRTVSDFYQAYERLAAPLSREYVFVRPEQEGAAMGMIGSGGPTVIVSEYLPEGTAYLYTPPDGEDPLPIERRVYAIRDVQ